ncbi:unnamed protein product [Acanthoscelides obtectus]|uniref:Mutator-like transposase domain-containing protein n=1 Tax=Acanthoscelides obtectus TaxID=200917 RepID=A0A9P0PRJ1_ACAOB|nr:unnamed protein product [Acanthoscelides obtectus]CAK1627323.1 hypothetical protein AOBTE_LOCUS4518 [Acanthoscelides obtectus]
MSDFSTWKELKRSGASRREIMRNYKNILQRITTSNSNPNNKITYYRSILNNTEPAFNSIALEGEEDEKINTAKESEDESAEPQIDNWLEELEPTEEIFIADTKKDAEFRRSLRTWAVSFNIPHSALKALFKHINDRTPNILPQDPRTLLKTCQAVIVTKIGNGYYWHHGLELLQQSRNENDQESTSSTIISYPPPASTANNKDEDTNPSCDSEYEDYFEELERRRIVNLGHMLFEYGKVLNHSKACTMGRMDFVEEKRIGHLVKLHFFCDNCEKRMVIESEPPCTTKKSVNTAPVWGSISTGIGHSQYEELMGVLNVPAMTSRTFRKKTSTVKKVWEEILNDDMKAAGIEEKRVAIEKGNLMPDGTPYITVIANGGWSKRTYGHGYNASSGVVS